MPALLAKLQSAPLLLPQTVNAYYAPFWNEMVFPAAILQPPFFTASYPMVRLFSRFLLRPNEATTIGEMTPMCVAIYRAFHAKIYRHTPSLSSPEAQL